jgi:hypothetical protein
MAFQRQKGKTQTATPAGPSNKKDGHSHKHRKKSRKDPLDMNVLFPKKRKRKEVLGTEESENPR